MKTKQPKINPPREPVPVLSPQGAAGLGIIFTKFQRRDISTDDAIAAWEKDLSEQELALALQGLAYLAQLLKKLVKDRAILTMIRRQTGKVVQFIPSDTKPKKRRR